jgi:Oligoribonuclease (3''->5'' exoribonuclease)
MPAMSEANNPVPPVLSKSDQNLVWLDCEMTGLEPDTDRLLEIAVIVTGPQAGATHRRPRVCHSSGRRIAEQDGRLEQGHARPQRPDRKVKASVVTEAEAEQQILEFLARYVPKGTAPMCGNSIGQDRRFLVRYMPKLERFFHYRNVDVSTLKELAKRWKPEAYSSFKKAQKHTALADVHESIDELAHYRKHLLSV